VQVYLRTTLGTLELDADLKLLMEEEESRRHGK
jgi:hypothetical protein